MRTLPNFSCTYQRSSCNAICLIEKQMPQSGGFIGLLQIKKSNLEVLLQRHVQMAAEIKNLDTDLQMLVYENYNKFISATDTIKRYL